MMTTAVGCHCDDADDGNDYDSADERMPPASFTPKLNQCNFSSPLPISYPDLSRVTSTVLLIKHLLYAQSELGDFYSDSRR